jgi:hypothetical protein
MRERRRRKSRREWHFERSGEWTRGGRCKKGEGGGGINADQQQFQINLKNAVPRLCECGGKYFQQVFMAYTIPPLMSPTGQELTVQQPALMCIECGAALK